MCIRDRLYLESNRQAIHDRLWRYAGLAVLVMLVSLLVTYLLSAAMQGQISRPILAVAETARAIAIRGDYSVRATKVGQDEIGLLTDAFNQMLGQIEEQNRAIWDSHERLNLSLIHISEPTRRTPISYAVFCLKKKNKR